MCIPNSCVYVQCIHCVYTGTDEYTQQSSMCILFEKMCILITLNAYTERDCVYTQQSNVCTQNRNVYTQRLNVYKCAKLRVYT